MFFYLAKPVKKELFELGSPLWNFVFPDFNTPFRFKEKFVTHGILYRRILKEIAEDFDLSIELRYFYDLAKKIKEWCGDDKVVLIEKANISDFDDWRITDSRYTDTNVSNSKNPIRKKAWAEFRETGLLWFVNRILHLFGWAIVLETAKNNMLDITDVYPARVTFRGFETQSEENGFKRVTKYLKENIDILLEEVE